MSTSVTPRFRRLSPAELQLLEKEFVEFLVTQSITAEDWEKLKLERSDQAESLICIFSDIVLQKVLEKLDLLELRSKHDLMFVECLGDKMMLTGMQVEGTDEVDLSTSFTKEQLQQYLSSDDVKVQLVSAEKAYRKSREEEVFQMLEGGYLISKNKHLLDRLKVMLENQ